MQNRNYGYHTLGPNNRTKNPLKKLLFGLLLIAILVLVILGFSDRNEQLNKTKDLTKLVVNQQKQTPVTTTTEQEKSTEKNELNTQTLLNINSYNMHKYNALDAPKVQTFSQDDTTMIIKTNNDDLGMSFRRTQVSIVQSLKSSSFWVEADIKYKGVCPKGVDPTKTTCFNADQATIYRESILKSSSGRRNLQVTKSPIHDYSHIRARLETARVSQVNSKTSRDICNYFVKLHTLTKQGKATDADFWLYDLNETNPTLNSYFGSAISPVFTKNSILTCLAPTYSIKSNDNIYTDTSDQDCENTKNFIFDVVLPYFEHEPCVTTGGVTEAHEYFVSLKEILLQAFNAGIAESDPVKQETNQKIKKQLDIDNKKITNTYGFTACEPNLQTCFTKYGIEDKIAKETFQKMGWPIEHVNKPNEQPNFKESGRTDESNVINKYIEEGLQMFKLEGDKYMQDSTLAQILLNVDIKEGNRHKESSAFVLDYCSTRTNNSTVELNDCRYLNLKQYYFTS